MIRGRKIGAFLATVLVATNMVGSGIFLLPATLAAVGSITVIGWGIGFAGALLIGLVLARLAQIAPREGGPCTYAWEALGGYFGFQGTAVYWISCWTGNIAVAVGAVGYLTTFFPVLASPLQGAMATAGAIWLLTLVNIIGPRFVCQLETVTVAAGLVPILLVAIGGWWWFDSQIFRDSWNPQHAPALTVIPNSLVLLFWAFTGLESASIATAVVENPSRNVPLATIGGIVIAAVIYTAATSAIMGLIPAATLAKSNAPFADAVRIMMGSGLGALVAAAALAKTLGTLGSMLLVTAQTGKAGADNGLFPAVFGRVDRAGIPVANYLINAVLASVVVFATISPTLGEQFGKLIDVSTTLCLLLYIYACLSMWHYTNAAGKAGATQPLPRAPGARDAPEGPDPRVTRYRVIAGLAASFCVGVIALSDLRLLATSAGVVLLTVPIYFARLRRTTP